MAKQVRKKKDIDLNIDTENVDLSITRKDGKTSVKLDTKNIDVNYEKDAEGKQDLDIKVEPGHALNLVKRVLTRVISKKRG